MDLGLDSDELNACVSCGLCLAHCPTFRVTGDEAYSPRGRIDAMRSVQLGDAPVDHEFHQFIDTCVQCRGCEPACPSGVRFGHLMETTRATLANSGSGPSRLQRLGYSTLRRPLLLKTGSRLIAVAQRMRLVPKRLGVPRIPVRSGPTLPATAAMGDEQAWIFTGCVMDAWMRSTHRSTAKILDLLGVAYGVTGDRAGCCGALHIHAGLHDQASDMAHQVIDAIGGDGVVVVNSAGCGAMLKEYADLVVDGEHFSQRVRDVNEYIADRIGALPAPQRRCGPVIVQDPCHLRHVQRSHASVRTVVGHFAEVVELADDGLCCGAGGAYAALQPELAGAIRERKVEAIRAAVASSGAKIMVSSNPGCLGHLEGMLVELGIRVCHPIDLLAEALGER
jgi:glycolate oxidase iron-sulfur subunit